MTDLPEKFGINPKRSKIWIDARSSLHAIHSETDGLEGWFEAEFLGDGRLDPKVTPKARLELPVDNLSSGNLLYDREMRRRVDARRYPTISGELTGMTANGHDGEYMVGGTITFRGVTRPYEERMALSMPDRDTLRLEGEHRFDIRDFGMDPPKILTLRVYPEVAVRVAIVATKNT